jgi:hypothetical protein
MLRDVRGNDPLTQIHLSSSTSTPEESVEEESFEEESVDADDMTSIASSIDIPLHCVAGLA